MTRIIILFSFLFGACSNESKQTSNQTADKLPQTDTATIQKLDSIVVPHLLVTLPRHKRTKAEIDKIVSDIDKLIKKGVTELVVLSGSDNEPCEIVRYYRDSVLIKMTFGCGDCSIEMEDESYYFKDNSLVCFKTYDVYYGYNPCWTEKDCKEYGITEKIKKENLKERNETYYLLDSTEVYFKRTGNFNDSLYVTNDTLSQAEILKYAIEYLNKKEPK
jgi:hypothetical protein